MKLFVVIILDDASLRNLIAEILEGWTRHQAVVEQTGFETRLPGLGQRWLREADLFVLGLERRYETGLRAEGVAVAETLWKAGRRVLLVGSESSGDRISVPFYWDIGSKDTFLEAAKAILDTRLPNSTERENFRQHFQARLLIPTGHRTQPI